MSRVSNAYEQDLRWLQALLEKNGCRLAVQTEEAASFGRILRLLEQGKHDLALGLSKTEAREKLFYFSVPYAVDRTFLYSMNDSTLPKTIHFDQLLAAQYRLLIPLHGWFGSEIDEARRHFRHHKNWINYHNDPEGLRLFKQHDHALLLMSERVFQGVSSAADKTKIRAVGNALFNDPLHIAFSRASVSEETFKHIDRTIQTSLKPLAR